MASSICYLIFISSLTVRFCDLSDYKLLVNGQVKSDNFGFTIAKFSYKYGLLRTSQIHIKPLVTDTIKDGNRLVDVSVDREIIESTALTLRSTDSKNRPQNSRETG